MSTVPQPVRVRPSLAILVVCTAVQPFALNVLAPATPAIARALGTDYGTIQLTLTLYLVAVAVSQLLVGPLSDRIGRRPCIVAGLGLFTLGSVAGLYSDSLVTLLAARMLQAVGAGTAFALTRAIARDTAEKDEAASLIGYMTMAMLIAPMTAPLVGGFVERTHGWRLIFGLMAVIGLVATLLAFAKLPETLKPGTRVGGWLDTFAAFPVLFRERAFVAHTLSLGMTSAVFFAFIAGAPHAVVDHMKTDAKTYGIMFIMLSGGYMLGNFLTGKLSRRVGAERLAAIGNVLSMVGVGLAVAFALLAPVWTPLLLFAPMMLNGIGNGLTIPTLTAAVLSVRPDMAGAASGLNGFTQLSLGATAAYVSGITTPLWPPAFLLLMLAATLSAMAFSKLNRPI
jgi:MFS transporter, DHA1 family, multidrug resistance protein